MPGLGQGSTPRSADFHKASSRTEEAGALMQSIRVTEANGCNILAGESLRSPLGSASQERGHGRATNILEQPRILCMSQTEADGLQQLQKAIAEVLNTSRLISNSMGAILGRSRNSAALEMGTFE
ncbi:hypothetical protein NPX13_g2443 [Xylaria arbuscula]|uniref:Uncharacterized protein n=1 Tax=Xylaria arbuscula TaxID=114810 RepID=A0A9W8TQC5_9PEZI|nr:hypothetical protein NPX13_g2443 [Xylaria arbuscula]